MSKIKTIILFTYFLASCNNIKMEEQNSSTKAAPITEPKSCYSFNNGKDSIKMSIEINNNEAKGDLNFNYYEKDSNKGTFKGRLNGDTLWATYTYQSEGIKSNREIVLLRQDNKWIQGYGEVVQKNENFEFVNHNAIRFDNSFTLKKVDCKP